MLFIKVKDADEAAKYLTRVLLEALNKDAKIIWLVSGGSNSEITVAALNNLPDNKINNLTLALVDERFGKPGHRDSNYHKLQQAGLDFSRVNFEAVLTSPDLNFDACLKSYENRLQTLFKEAAVVIGQFGIGADGHTAGILPHSEACSIDDRLVIGYQAADFQRITLSFTAIKRIDQAYVFAFGEDKRPTLSLLHGKDLPLADQPAQIFRQYPAKSFIINNIIGD